ncbi:hypothetical protein E8E13_002058 [Curvularia kusanoi]|uniref:Uncharacterized protein n=1 Tax=Curvularia kusanoi TaxID=90978 RepID=A0A9P4T5Y4_CURKU|nr:hypothetical protein E8E13_002058 [Curvularia kusanoi]
MAPPPAATENGDGQHVQTAPTSGGGVPEEAATSNILSRLLIPGTEAVARQVGLRRWNRYCLESMCFYRKWITYENFLDSEEEVLQGISELERYRTRDALQLHIEVYAELRQLNTLYMYFLGYKPRET